MCKLSVRVLFKKKISSIFSHKSYPSFSSDPPLVSEQGLGIKTNDKISLTNSVVNDFEYKLIPRAFKARHQLTKGKKRYCLKRLHELKIKL